MHDEIIKKQILKEISRLNSVNDNFKNGWSNVRNSVNNYLKLIDIIILGKKKKIFKVTNKEKYFELLLRHYVILLENVRWMKKKNKKNKK